MLLKEAEENDESDDIDNDTEMVSCISSPVLSGRRLSFGCSVQDI